METDDDNSLHVKSRKIDLNDTGMAMLGINVEDTEKN
jgi:hypothetical protein